MARHETSRRVGDGERGGRSVLQVNEMVKVVGGEEGKKGVPKIERVERSALFGDDKKKLTEGNCGRAPPITAAGWKGSRDISRGSANS